MFVHWFVFQSITNKKHVCTFICNSTNHQKMNVQRCFFLVIGWITNECTKMFLFGDWLNYKWMYKHKKKHLCTFICNSTNHQKETSLYIHLYFNQSPKRNIFVHSFVIQPITNKKHLYWLNYKWMYTHVSFWWLVELQMNVQTCFLLVIDWNTNQCTNMFVHSFVIQPITKKKHVCTFICNSTNHQKETCLYIDLYFNQSPTRNMFVHSYVSFWWLVELQMNVQRCFFLVIGWTTNECTNMFLFGDWLNYKWMYKHEQETSLYIHL
jgi:hypothetical protein